LFWSSSPVAGSPSLAWYVDFNDGTTVIASGVSFTDLYVVRCVR
jgi:hypothetical protein